MAYKKLIIGALLFIELLLTGCGGAPKPVSSPAPAPTPAPSPAPTPNPAPDPLIVYPLKLSPDGRYLVDQNNNPVLITGDSPQALISNLSQSDADAFLANRKSAGFNAVWINLLSGSTTGGRQDGSTYDGIVPFTTAGDLSTPNEAYFSRADAYLQLAAKYGLVVFLDPIETGSWLAVLQNNGITKARNYGRYVGNRYKGLDNIVWLNGNDFQTWQNPSDDAVAQAVAQGIQDMDNRHISTVELNYFVSGSLDDISWAPLIQLSSSYTYYPTYAEVLKDYNRPNFLPDIMLEANYEFEREAGTNPQILRRQEYWSLLSGAAGQFYGNGYTWQFMSGWQTHLDTPGSIQMAYVNSLFSPRRWSSLVPDQNHAVVTSGYGTFADSGNLGGNDYLTAAATSDGTLAIAYMPTIRTISVDFSKFSGPVHPRWYDPTNGTYLEASNALIPNSSTRTLVPPQPNSEGTGDWVLLLEVN